MQIVVQKTTIEYVCTIFTPNNRLFFDIFRPKGVTIADFLLFQVEFKTNGY